MKCRFTKLIKKLNCSEEDRAALFAEFDRLKKIEATAIYYANINETLGGHYIDCRTLSLINTIIGNAKKSGSFPWLVADVNHKESVKKLKPLADSSCGRFSDFLRKNE